MALTSNAVPIQPQGLHRRQRTDGFRQAHQAVGADRQALEKRQTLEHIIRDLCVWGGVGGAEQGEPSSKPWKTASGICGREWGGRVRNGSEGLPVHQTQTRKPLVPPIPRPGMAGRGGGPQTDLGAEVIASTCTPFRGSGGGAEGEGERTLAAPPPWRCVRAGRASVGSKAVVSPPPHPPPSLPP